MSDATNTRTADAAPPPLARHDGERRYQDALDTDRVYRLLLAAALLLAAFAGSGFGLLPYRSEPLLGALWSITVAGLIVRCVAGRSALQWQSRDDGAIASGGDILAILAPCVAFMVSARSGGGAIMTTVGIAAGCALVLWLLSRPLRAMARATGIAVILGTGAAGLWLARRNGGGDEISAAAIGIAVGLAAAASAYRPGLAVNPLLAVTRLAGVGWALLGWGKYGQEVGALLFALVVLIVIDVMAIRRRTFIALAAAVMFVELAALPPGEELLRGSLLLQFPVAAVIFGLLVLAGMRHVAASLRRMPGATYRIAPLCVVPRLDRGRDHPVKISVA